MLGSKADFSCTRTISEDLYTLASRIEDVDHGKDWLDSCVKSNTIPDASNPTRRPNRVEFEAYERLKGNTLFNIDDRDVYLHGSWRRDGNGLVCRLTLSQLPHEAPPPGVVRMRDLRGTFTLRPVDARATAVTYALNVDLGGSIPDFVKDLAVNEIPRKSLDNLAREAGKGPGVYAETGQELAQALGDAT